MRAHREKERLGRILVKDNMPGGGVADAADLKFSVLPSDTTQFLSTFQPSKHHDCTMKLKGYCNGCIASAEAQ
jgi:hypothetical protein